MQEGSQILTNLSTTGHQVQTQKKTKIKVQPKEPTIKQKIWKNSPFTCSNISLVSKGTKVILVASDLSKKDCATFESSFLRTDILSLFMNESEDFSTYNKFSEKKIGDKLKDIKEMSILATESKPFKYLLGVNTSFFSKLTEKKAAKPHVKEWLATQQMLNEMFELVSSRNLPSLTMNYPWRDFNNLLDKNLFKYLKQLLASWESLNLKSLKKIVIVVEGANFNKSCENLTDIFREQK